MPVEQDLIRWHLHAALVEPEPARDVETIHASDLTRESPEFCPREAALYRLTGKEPEDQHPTAAQALVYRIGRDMQITMTDLLARAGVAVGDWRCLDCARLHVFRRRPRTCEGCGGARFDYIETRFRSRLCGASGGIDVMAALPGRAKALVVEIKGEQKDEFQLLKFPRAEHRVRTQLYLRLIAESDDPIKHLVDTTEARVLYVTKGGWGSKDPAVREWRLGDGDWSPFKEFVIHRDDQACQLAWERAAAVNRYQVEGVMPAGICATRVCQRAKWCPVVHECFGGRYPAGEQLCRR